MALHGHRDKDAMKEWYACREAKQGRYEKSQTGSLSSSCGGKNI